MFIFSIDVYLSTLKVLNLRKFLMKNYFKEQLRCESLLELVNEGGDVKCFCFSTSEAVIVLLL